MNIHDAILYTHIENKVRCLVCPRLCTLSEGETGYCGVRKNISGELKTLIYSLVSSAAVDPIEKKPLFHFFPGSRVFSVGSFGCNFRCLGCQNWQIACSQPTAGEDISPDYLLELAKRYSCRGVAWTYNEPTIWIEYVLDSAKIIKKSGLYTVMVTNGYITLKALDVIAPYIDAYRVDLKGIRGKYYREAASVEDIKPILLAIKTAKDKYNCHIEIVTNVVPGYNDSSDEISETASWIKNELGEDTPWHITRFFPQYELSDLMPTSVEKLKEAYKIAKGIGLNYVYMGNLTDGEENTYCPFCAELLIERNGYEILRNQLKSDKCPKCGKNINIKGINYV
ncbi:AmmeMemoRadiSam system radical SAM enzyme [Thermodesulfobium sp. 4217-1]|uniref:AmmeMemoRadiSam system radical SAM enzyme n=1 Tax=Thermodesulfobium sp. 4217-1 TaxID=3120013 RepID=UPI003221AC10